MTRGDVSAENWPVDYTEKVLRDEYSKFLAESSESLKGLKELASADDHKFLDRLSKKIARVDTDIKSEKRPVSQAMFDDARFYFGQAIENLKESFGQRNNVLRQVKALREAGELPSFLSDDLTLAALNKGAIDMYRNSPDPSKMTSNVLGKPSKVSDELIEEVKSFEGTPYFKNPGHVTRKAIRLASMSSARDVAKNIANIEKIIESGRPLSEQEGAKYEVDYKKDDTPDFVRNAYSNLGPINGAIASGVNRLANLFPNATESVKNNADRFARRVSKKSRPDDSVKFKKFIRHRDQALQKLVRELRSGGIATSIMDMIEAQINANGYIDPVTFAQIMKHLDLQRQDDKEGISDEILNEFNKLTKKAVEAGEKDSENDDSRTLIRILQLALIAAAFMGIPLLGPVVAAFSSAIFGSGLAQGVPALMTADFLGPIGDFAGAVKMDVATEFLLTQTPIVSEVIGGVDYLITNSTSQILGQSIIACSGFPLIPIAGAALLVVYGQMDRKYHDTDKQLKDKFDGFSDKIDKIVLEKIGIDTSSKGAGGALAEEGARRKFVEEKFSFMEKSNQINGIANFIDILHGYCQSNGGGDELLSKVFSSELLGFLQDNGLEDMDHVLDKSRITQGVANLIYGLEGGKGRNGIANELFERFGLFNYACETSPRLNNLDHAEFLSAIVEGFSGAIENQDPDISRQSEMGNDMHDARFVQRCAIQRGVELNADFNFAGKLFDEVSGMSASLKGVVDKARSDMIEKESAEIKKSIDNRFVNADISESYNRSPSPSTSARDISPLDRALRAIEVGV